jgi:flagellar motility protein MotE (MotC chaperone)
MAEERRDRAPGGQERPAEGSGAAPLPVAKKKKQFGKGSMFFLLLLLSFGAGAGLHFSGLWDARPLVWEVIPQIPYVGKGIADFFGIPEQYTLTVAARRAYEQNERQKRLDERERDLIDRESAVDVASADVGLRSRRLVSLEEAAKENEAKRAEATASDNEKTLIAQRVKDFNTMSSSRAAKITEEMREDLAVKILQGLTSEARSSILGRMDAKKAARLVDLLAKE